jgi:predicted RNase H-like nuclease
LVIGGKLQGITLAAETPVVASSILDVLDRRPGYEIIMLHAPVGLLEEPRPRGRQCDQDARRVLGMPRAGAIVTPPARSTTNSGAFDGLNPIQRALLPRITEVAKEIQPYHQRTVYEGHPELSFYQLNEDVPMRYSKHMEAGREERRALLTWKLPGIERALDERVERARSSHVLDAAALLWTARRVAARAVRRLPEDPEWDQQGLRMEIVR